MNAEQMRIYRSMVRELLNLEHGLSQWEIDFLDSLHDWEGDFRPKQVAKLEQVYQRHLGV